MLRIALFLVIGIFLGHEMADAVVPSLWLAGLVSSVGIAFFLFRYPILQTACLLLSVSLLGAFLVSRQDARLSLSPDDDELVHRAVLVSQPVERGKIVRCDLRLVEGRYAGRLVKASILRDTVDHRYRQLNVGDGIIMRSVLERPRQFRQSNFNYPLYLRCHGFSATTFVYWDAWMKESVRLHSMSAVERVRLRALMLRQRLLSSLSVLNIDAENMAVLSAMALGEKSGLSREVRDAYSVSGASHILALSGLHLGIIYGLLSLLFRFRRFRFAGELLILVAIWTYAFIVGLTPSVTRAATMISIYSLMGLPLGSQPSSCFSSIHSAFMTWASNSLSLRCSSSCCSSDGFIGWCPPRFSSAMYHSGGYGRRSSSHARLSWALLLSSSTISARFPFISCWQIWLSFL